MRYEPLPKDLFTRNRKALAGLLKPRSLAVFQSNDIQSTSADGTRPFIQHTDIYYLSGIDQEESVLVVFPDARKEEHRAVLFLKETSEEIAIWEGAKLTKEQASELSGVATVYWLQDFERIFTVLAYEAEHFYLNTNEHLRNAASAHTPDDRFRQWCKEHFPLHKYERVAPLMHQLRAVKHAEEVATIQQACQITEKGFRRLLSFVQPGVAEYEIEAELAHEFLRNRSMGFAYEPIIASGSNACVLHYIANNQICRAGDLLLMDFGAEYANYASDLTRTIPVLGRFTDRQKAVYNAVLNVQKAAIDMLRPGTIIETYHKDVGKLMEVELIKLGLLDQTEVAKQDPEKPLYKKYFMHGTSHHLGLNVHDYGNFYEPIQPGMVFTVEPGIYIRDEGIGIRLEDNIVVTEGAPRNLMANIPKEVEEIEELMQAGR